MKSGVDYYRHDTNSHSNYKFKMLRVRYGWAGEGRFWALNNLIAQEEGCILDLNNKLKKIKIAGDLDMSLSELDEFVRYLWEECDRLIEFDKGKITTKDVQEVWEMVSRKRSRNKDSYEEGKKISEYQKKLSADRKADSDSRSEDSTDRKGDSDSRSEDSANNVFDELLTGLMKWFGFNEMNHFPQLREITKFLGFLRDQEEQLEHFKEQFYFYRKLKKESGEKKHGFVKYLGTKENEYNDGAWNTENWKKKYAEWSKENNPETPKVRRTG